MPIREEIESYGKNLNRFILDEIVDHYKIPVFNNPKDKLHNEYFPKVVMNKLILIMMELLVEKGTFIVNIQDNSPQFNFTLNEIKLL